MKHRQETVATKNWDGELGSFDEWARLGPQPPYRSATLVDAQGRLALLSKILFGHGTMGIPGKVLLGGD
jgi:hypothetical protein